jgi:hypothetical protein
VVVLRTENRLGVWGKVRGTRGHKDYSQSDMAMEGGGFSFLSPEHVPLFKVGDCVQVFEGTGTGQVKMRSVAWFSRVVGMREGKFLVRILAGRGSPALVEGQYLALQTDFGLGVGSGERTHYRNLSKRTRERIEQSVDRRNDFVVKEARKEINKLKTKQTKDTEAHRDRFDKLSAKSNTAVNEAKVQFKEQLEYWKSKCNDTLQTKKVKPYPNPNPNPKPQPTTKVKLNANPN